MNLASSDTFRSLGNRNFRLFFAGQIARNGRSADAHFHFLQFAEPTVPHQFARFMKLA